MPDADLVLKNLNVITMDPEQPAAELVAVKGDRILMVAGNDSLESVRGTGTTVIDCQGKTVVPGFNDAHCHIFSLLRKLLSIDLSPSSVSSINGIKTVIGGEARNTPPGKWIGPATAGHQTLRSSPAATTGVAPSVARTAQCGI